MVTKTSISIRDNSKQKGWKQKRWLVDDLMMNTGWKTLDRLPSFKLFFVSLRWRSFPKYVGGDVQPWPAASRKLLFPGEKFRLSFPMPPGQFFRIPGQCQTAKALILLSKATQERCTSTDSKVLLEFKINMMENILIFKVSKPWWSRLQNELISRLAQLTLCWIAPLTSTEIWIVGTPLYSVFNEQ